MRRLVKLSLPLYLSILLFVFIVLFTFFVTRKMMPSVENPDVTVAPSPKRLINQLKVQRLSGYQFIKPLMFVDTYTKSEKYSPLAQKIAAYIEAKKQTNEINGASFYFRDVDKGEWTGYNENDKYYPGSLMKVPVLITYLHLEEEMPGTLNKTVFYTQPSSSVLNPVFLSKKIEPGHMYTVRELLKYMITYSDNNASSLLAQYLDSKTFFKLFTDLGLQSPDNSAMVYPISAKDYSLFMRTIYNAAYLTIAHSEYAAELLSTTDFKDGFAKGFPSTIKMIHKFGESGTEQERCLNESGIIYVNNKSYILTVMTKGKEFKSLSATISDIAAMVYQQVSTQ